MAIWLVFWRTWQLLNSILDVNVHKDKNVVRIKARGKKVKTTTRHVGRIIIFFYPFKNPKNKNKVNIISLSYSENFKIIHLTLWWGLPSSDTDTDTGWERLWKQRKQARSLLSKGSWICTEEIEERIKEKDSTHMRPRVIILFRVDKDEERKPKLRNSDLGKNIHAVWEWESKYRFLKWKFMKNTKV